MKKTVLALATASALALAGCSTNEAIFGGALSGAAIGGLATKSVPGAILGAAVGGIAGAVLVKHLNNGMCVYRSRGGKLYTDRCHGW